MYAEKGLKIGPRVTDSSRGTMTIPVANNELEKVIKTNNDITNSFFAFILIFLKVSTAKLKKFQLSNKNAVRINR
jgi:hypothetical protein